MVKDSLSKIFNFSMNDTVVYDSIWIATVVDTEKLSQYVVSPGSSSGGVSERVMNQNLALNDASVSKLTDRLAELLGLIIKDESRDQRRYNFNVTISGFENVREELLENYGIQLAKEYRPIEVLEVAFL